MIRSGLGPLLLGLVLAVATYMVTLRQTPRVLMSAAVSRLSKLGINSFAHTPLATDKSRAIVRPSPDLAYSSCAFDLTRGPVAITAAPVPARYWSLSVFQADTDVAFVRNNVESGGKPVSIVVAQQGQQVPQGANAVRVEGARGVALIRILVDDRARFPEIDRARRAATCRSLAG